MLGGNRECIHVQGKHVNGADWLELHSEAATSQRFNQVRRVSARKQKSREMRESLHGSAECLLANERQGVGVVNNNPAKRIGLCMRPFTEIIDLVANRVNSAVLLAG